MMSALKEWSPMRKAFALLDILNAILILALVASLFVPVYRAEKNKAGYAESLLNLKSIAIAIEKNYLETGAYVAFEKLADISGPESVLVKEKFLKEIPTKDFWDRTFKGSGDEKGYKLEGYGIPTRSQSLMREYPDYSFSTGLKLQQKGKRN